MTIIEALKESKESGKSYMRVKGGGGFCRYEPDFLYEFETDDLLADDWECVDTGIPKLTDGRWEASGP